MIHKLVRWDKLTAIWWAGTCELTFHFDLVLFWVTSPFPPAHQGLTHAGPTLCESSRLAPPLAQGAVLRAKRNADARRDTIPSCRPPNPCLSAVGHLRFFAHCLASGDRVGE